MVEKDILLHQILIDLSNEKFFSDNFLFKGGTCLTKRHLDYYRFSEDIDFTWKNQSSFAGMTKRSIRKTLSATIGKVGDLLEKISIGRGLDFKCMKNDRRYVEIGGGGRICTFKLWFTPVSLETETFLKIQVSFIEILCMEHKKGELKSVIVSRDKKLTDVYPEYLDYSRTIPFNTYGVNEILSEKIRAILTRRRFKARDFYDVFQIQKKFKTKPQDVEKCIIEKTNLSTELYSKYRSNLVEKQTMLENNDIIMDDESNLLLIAIDQNEFEKFLTELVKYLKTLLPKLDISRV